MSTHLKRPTLILLVLLAAFASPLRASIVIPAPGPGVPIKPSGAFFDLSTYYGDEPNRTPLFFLAHFGVFTVDLDNFNYVYKFGFGWVYDFGGTTSTSTDVYLYDFQTGDTLYTSADLYPYFYSFNKSTFLYYYEGGFPRYFYDFSAGQVISYPVTATVN